MEIEDGLFEQRIVGLEVLREILNIQWVSFHLLQNPPPRCRHQKHNLHNLIRSHNNGLIDTILQQTILNPTLPLPTPITIPTTIQITINFISKNIQFLIKISRYFLHILFNVVIIMICLCSYICICIGFDVIIAVVV